MHSEEAEAPRTQLLEISKTLPTARVKEEEGFPRLVPAMAARALAKAHVTFRFSAPAVAAANITVAAAELRPKADEAFYHGEKRVLKI